MTEQESIRTWTEAPASATVKAVVGGRDWMLTMRADTVRELVERVNTLNGWLDSHADAALNVEQPRTQATPPVAPIQSANGVQTFAAESLSATVTDGKPYWKVKGGRFKKFGVTVWDEVLTEAGLAECDPMQAYSLQGWTAHYITKADGKPEKVIRLEKP